MIRHYDSAEALAWLWEDPFRANPVDSENEDDQYYQRNSRMFNIRNDGCATEAEYGECVCELQHPPVTSLCVRCYLYWNQTAEFDQIDHSSLVLSLIDMTGRGHPHEFEPFVELSYI